MANKEILLINTLLEKGKWQSELIKSGFNYALINSMVSKSYLDKSKRKKSFRRSKIIS